MCEQTDPGCVRRDVWRVQWLCFFTDTTTAYKGHAAEGLKELGLNRCARKSQSFTAFSRSTQLGIEATPCDPSTVDLCEPRYAISDILGGT